MKTSHAPYHTAIIMLSFVLLTMIASVFLLGNPQCNAFAQCREKSKASSTSLSSQKLSPLQIFAK